MRIIHKKEDESPPRTTLRIYSGNSVIDGTDRLPFFIAV
jgi:hypothetical protein